jgi:hypothetical protein
MHLMLGMTFILFQFTIQFVTLHNFSSPTMFLHWGCDVFIPLKSSVKPQAQLSDSHMMQNVQYFTHGNVISQ